MNTNSQIEELLREYDQDNNNQQDKLENTDDLLAAMEKEYKSLFPNKKDALADITEDNKEGSEYSYYDEEEDQDEEGMPTEQGEIVQDAYGPIKFEVIKDGPPLKMDDFEIIDLGSKQEIMVQKPPQVSGAESDSHQLEAQDQRLIEPGIKNEQISQVNEVQLTSNANNSAVKKDDILEMKDDRGTLPLS